VPISCRRGDPSEAQGLRHNVPVTTPLDGPDQGRTGYSNRLWLSRQTGPNSSGVTRNSGVGRPLHKYPSIAPGPFPIPFPSSLSSFVILSLAPHPFPANGESLLTNFNCRRHTWQVPGGPVRPKPDDSSSHALLTETKQSCLDGGAMTATPTSGTPPSS